MLDIQQTSALLLAFSTAATCTAGPGFWFMLIGFLLSFGSALRALFWSEGTIRLDTAYWGLKLIAWIHATLGAVAGIPWNPKRRKNRSCIQKEGETF